MDILVISVTDVERSVAVEKQAEKLGSILRASGHRCDMLGLPMQDQRELTYAVSLFDFRGINRVVVIAPHGTQIQREGLVSWAYRMEDLRFDRTAEEIAEQLSVD